MFPLLGILLLVVTAYFLYKKLKTKKKKAAIQFSNLSYIKSAIGNKKKTKRDSMLFYISIGIIVLMVIGFADPHIPLEQTKEGVNVVLVIDVSGSMQAEDYSPNRLESAKRSADILLVQTLSDCIDSKFVRLQFTPDLLPADITGTKIYNLFK